MAVDRYRTLSGPGEGIHRELASRFIGLAFPITDEAAFKQVADRIARDHPSARHVCHAWVLGAAGERFRANDDGEPNATAGRPILRQIQAMGLTFCAVVVVRYFGGTLLGKPGLIQAYGTAARLALTAAPAIECVVMERSVITCGYDRFEMLKNDVSKAGGKILNSVFTDGCEVLIELPLGTSEILHRKWASLGMASAYQ